MLLIAFTVMLLRILSKKFTLASITRRRLLSLVPRLGTLQPFDFRLIIYLVQLKPRHGRIT